jgi:hypothetical protein
MRGEGLHPAMPISLGLLLVEDRDAEPSHGLTCCLKCCFESWWVNKLLQRRPLEDLCRDRDREVGTWDG